MIRKTVQLRASAELKTPVRIAAASAGIGVTDWLDRAIRDALAREGIPHPPAES